jgi:hypothetical protein
MLKTLIFPSEIGKSWTLNAKYAPSATDVSITKTIFLIGAQSSTT